MSDSWDPSVCPSDLVKAREVLMRDGCVTIGLGSNMRWSADR